MAVEGRRRLLTSSPHGARTGHFFLALAAGRVPATVSGGFDWVDVRDVVSALTVADLYAFFATQMTEPAHYWPDKRKGRSRARRG